MKSIRTIGEYIRDIYNKIILQLSKSETLITPCYCPDKTTLKNNP